MVLQGETIHRGAPRQCPECRAHLYDHVMESNAGYYIGTSCDDGPYSRESGYYATQEEATKALAEGGYER